MKSKLAQVEFYFPVAGPIENKRTLAESIVSQMSVRESVVYSGYKDEQTLLEGIIEYMGNGDVRTYQPFSDTQIKEIQSDIEQVILRCNETLSVPTKNFVFVFPYLPTENDKVFHGVMGVAVYSCVFHLFVSPQGWSKEALADTVAHELNHTIFYTYHYDDFNNYTLRDEMILEGLAENFRENTLNTPPSLWAGALTKEKAFEALQTLDKETLLSKDRALIKKVLFGGDRYERWYGYSIGYWLVKNFLQKHQDISWDEIMRIPSSDFFGISQN